MSDYTTLRVEWPTTWDDYELIDSGNGERLERFGPHMLVRPEPHALWQPRLPADRWREADARFVRDGDREFWLQERPLREPWVVHYGDLRVHARLTPFKHTGIFPEQAVNWEWCAERIRARGGVVRVLNLFAYTGIASLAAAQAGAHVTHVDASKPAMTWARENQRLSKLEALPIRWLIDDVVKFVRREGRRGRRYDGFILDPPAFGRGPKGEIWRFAEGIPELMRELARLVSDAPLFLLLNAYAISDSATVLYNLVAEAMAPYGGAVEAGELALKETNGGRLLSTSLFARWQAER